MSPEVRGWIERGQRLQAAGKPWGLGFYCCPTALTVPNDVPCLVHGAQEDDMGLIEAHGLLEAYAALGKQSRTIADAVAMRQA